MSLGLAAKSAHVTWGQSFPKTKTPVRPSHSDRMSLGCGLASEPMARRKSCCAVVLGTSGWGSAAICSFIKREVSDISDLGMRLLLLFHHVLCSTSQKLPERRAVHMSVPEHLLSVVTCKKEERRGLERTWTML